MSSEYRILAIGDPHFQTNNLQLLDEYTDKIISVIQSRNVNLVVILGDLLHTHEKLHTLVLNKAYVFIRRLSEITKTIVLVGNHDYINNTQFLSENHWMVPLKNIPETTIVDQGHVLDTCIGKLVFVPYVFPGRFEEALTITDPTWKESRFVFAHQEIKGCKMGAIVSVEGDEWYPNYPYLVSGHIHNKQEIGDNVFYTGSSIQHAFGESFDKTISLFTVTNTNFEREDIDLQMKRKKIITMDIDSVRNYTKNKHSEDDIRINLKCDMEEFKVFKKTTAYKNLLKDNIKIVCKPPLETTRELMTGTHDDFNTTLWENVKNEPDMVELYNTYIRRNK